MKTVTKLCIACAIGHILFVAISATPKGRRQSVVLDHCPNGASRHDSSCYIASHAIANWPEAMVYCQAYAGHLVFINDAREQQFMAEFVKNHSAGSTDPDHYYWIGGLDALTEGEWFWEGTLEPVAYTNWKPGEPNNNQDHQSHHQDCMAIYGATGLWDDGWCETKHNFVCEIEIDTEAGIIG